ncbi:MAG: sugar transferase [Burkholderiales bacterium]|nr:sugar transferase [Opitutaceae bacterium]
MRTKRTFPRTQNYLLTLVFLGDALFCYCGLTLGYLLRVKTPLRKLGIEPTNLSFENYQPLLWLGTIFLLGTYSALKLYDARLLLRPHRASSVIFRGTFIWFLAFLGFSLAFRFEPSISRIFAALSSFTCMGAMVTWRYIFYHGLSSSKWRERLTQKVVIIGWNSEAERLVEAIDKDDNHPYSVIGVIVTKPEDAANPRQFLGERLLGDFQDLNTILQKHPVDIAAVADLELNSEQILETVHTCERLYVQFKIVPSFFQIFVSSLRMQTISGVPILGVESLPITHVANQATKRAIDIIGGLVGFFGSLPMMISLAIIIKKQSPGPVIYRQIRTGMHGKPFVIYKLRSMRLDAEVAGAQWCVADDPRRLPIGAFMRKWNLDELPQFWNVLRGDMSLVGPRPERPELIAKFEHEIPHYNPRHEVRPGLTGWAQVNGLRGNTSLVDRIKYDLYYIENWSVWFDLQIMLLTFVKRDNAY